MDIVVLLHLTGVSLNPVRVKYQDQPVIGITLIHVTVATSDALEQLIVIGQGAVRMSSRELKAEVERVGGKSLAQHAKKSGNGKNSQILHPDGISRRPLRKHLPKARILIPTVTQRL